MNEKKETIIWKIIWILPMIGAVLIIISLFTPFAVSKGVEGISIASQSDVWYWGWYREQGLTEFLQIPLTLNVILSIIMLFCAMLILVFSIEYGLNNLNRKSYGEIIAIITPLIYFSMTLTIKFIEYAFSLMPDSEIILGKYAHFWVYRLGSFGSFGIYLAIILINVGSILSLSKSKKSFFYIEITAFTIWMFGVFFTEFGPFAFY